MFEPTEGSEVGSDSCQTLRCVNPEPTEHASKLGFHPVLNLSSCVVFRGSLSRRCILSTFSLLKLIGLLIFLYQGLYCL